MSGPDHNPEISPELRARIDADQERARERVSTVVDDGAAFPGGFRVRDRERIARKSSVFLVHAHVDGMPCYACEAQRPEVGSVHPWAVARADMEAHPAARWGQAKYLHGNDHLYSAGSATRLVDGNLQMYRLAPDRDWQTRTDQRPELLEWKRQPDGIEQRDVMPAQADDADGDQPQCEFHGTMELVRPGKWQCSLCEVTTSPAKAMEAATTVFDESPLAAARRELEELMPVERSHMPTITDCAIDKLVDAASVETMASHYASMLKALGDYGPESWAGMYRRVAELSAERDRLRHEKSLALDHVARLRGVSARLVEALDLMTELLTEAP